MRIAGLPWPGIFVWAALTLASWGVLPASGLPVPTPVLRAVHIKASLKPHKLPSAADWRGARATAILTRAINSTDSTFPAAAHYHTRVEMLWTTRTLYVRFICRGQARGVTLRGNNLRLYQQDVAEIFIGAVGNIKNYVEIQVSPLGFHAVYRHRWLKAPTFSAGKINWTQVAKYHRESLWHLPGLSTSSIVLKQHGQPVGWIATMAIPVRALLRAIGKPPTRLQLGQRLRANFVRYVYLPAAQAKRILHQFNWVPTTHGCPHVTPMAMGNIVLSPAAKKK